MKRRNIIITMLVGLFFITACSSAASPNSVLLSTAWTLIDLNGETPLEGSAITIEFSEYEISGNAGCNSFGGSYTIRDSEMTISDLYSTEMGCMEPEGIMEQELTYLEILRNVSMFELTDDVLTLIVNERAALIFQKTPSGLPSPIVEDDPNEAVSATNPDVEEVDVAPVPPAPPDNTVLFTDESARIGIYIPEHWIVSQTYPGGYTILQSYPIDNYVGGETLEAEDTKCDLTVQSAFANSESLIQDWESNPTTDFTSMKVVELESGIRAHRIELENMGTALVYVYDLDPQVITLTCFGNFAPVEAIATTLHKIGED